jgi:hypothetical protein
MVPRNPLETKAFAVLGRIPRDQLAGTVSAFDAIPGQQRNRLFVSSLLLDPDVPLEATARAHRRDWECASRQDS